MKLPPVIAGNGIISTVGSNISFVSFRFCSDRRSCFFNFFSFFNDRRKKRKRKKHLNPEKKRTTKATENTENRTPNPSRNRNQQNQKHERQNERKKPPAPQDHERHGGAPRPRQKEKQAPPNGTQPRPAGRTTHEQQKHATQRNTSESNSDDNGTTAAARQRLNNRRQTRASAAPRFAPAFGKRGIVYLKNDLHFHFLFFSDHFLCFLRRYAALPVYPLSRRYNESPCGGGVKVEALPPFLFVLPL